MAQKTIEQIIKYKDGKVWYRYSDSMTAIFYQPIDVFITRIIENKVDVKLRYRSFNPIPKLPARSSFSMFLADYKASINK